MCHKRSDLLKSIGKTVDVNGNVRYYNAKGKLQVLTAYENPTKSKEIG